MVLTKTASHFQYQLYDFGTIHPGGAYLLMQQKHAWPTWDDLLRPLLHHFDQEESIGRGTNPRNRRCNHGHDGQSR